MPTSSIYKALEKGVNFEDFAFHTTTVLSHVASTLIEKGDQAIPELEKELITDTYYYQAKEKAEKRLKGLLKMSFARAAKAAKKEYDKKVTTYQTLIAERAMGKVKLERMLEQAKAYEAPATARGAEHKRFMIDQLTDALKRDMDSTYFIEALENLKLLTGAEWRKKEIEKAKEEITNDTKELTDRKQQLTNDVTFIAGVREALKKVPEPKKKYF